MNDLERAYLIAAEVVAKYGAEYLPIFERLHTEIECYRERQDLIELSRKVVIEHQKYIE